MTITADAPQAAGDGGLTPEAYAASRMTALLAAVREARAESRAVTHPDVIAVATGKPVPPDPRSVHGPVNDHPGPDFDWEVSA